MSMDKGEPAFPCEEWRNTSSDPLAKPKHIIHTGISKRDWFAGMALMGRMARNSHYATWEDAAKDAYEAADAMLAEGKAPK
jgi:hypothetical protein